MLKDISNTYYSHTHTQKHAQMHTHTNTHMHAYTYTQVNATNKAKQHRIKGTIACDAVTYTGRVLREDVKKAKVDLRVNKGKTEQVSMVVDGSIFSEFSGTKVWLIFPNRDTVMSTC